MSPSGSGSAGKRHDWTLSGVLRDGRKTYEFWRCTRCRCMYTQTYDGTGKFSRKGHRPRRCAPAPAQEGQHE